MGSNQLLSSKVTIEEEAPSVRAVPDLPTAVGGFEGVTEKGPFVATLITSFEEYVSIFGSHIANSDMCAVVQAFFSNGGSTCWISRVAHYTDVNTPATRTSAKASVILSTAPIAATAAVNTSGAGPYALTSGQTLVVLIDDESLATTTFTATSAARTAANGTSYALSDAQTLTVEINDGAAQTVVFHTADFAAIGTATPAEVAAVINAVLVGASCDLNGGRPRITSDQKGTGSKVHVTGGTANSAIGFVTDEVVGTGNVANITAVSAAEVVTALHTSLGSTATVSNVSGSVRITSATTGADSHVQVTGASTATAIGFDTALHTGDASGTLQTLKVWGKYDGAYAHNLRPLVEAATSGKSGEFNFSMQTLAGIKHKTYPNVVIGAANADATNYIETVVNNANTGDVDIEVEDLLAATSAVNAVPALGLGAALSGGDDGLTSLDDNDYAGSEAGQTGLHAFDSADTLRLLAVPGRATSAVHNAMVTYCSVFRGGNVFAILDPPASQTASQINTYATTTASLLGLSESGMLYWPRWKITNPSKAIYGTADRITVPLSGHIMGMCARVDGAREGGVYDVPAGPDFGKLYGLLETEDSGVSVAREAVRDLIFPNRINPVWSGTGMPVNLDGARTLKADGNWPTVAQRRGVSNIEIACQRAMQIFRQKRRDDDLIAAQLRTLDTYLSKQCALGAFASKDPAKAYRIDMGPALNPRSIPNRTKARIGVATAQPNEFIVLAFSEDLSLGA